MSDTPKFIAIVDDRLWKSIGRDVFSIASLIAAVGVGVLLGSDALQWIAGIVWLILILGKSAQTTKTRYTVAEARRLLEELEAEK